MKKKFITLLSILLVDLIVSCASMQNIYTIGADYGQLYFIRSTEVKKVPKALKSFDFDITVRADKAEEIIDNPVLNYTFNFDKNHYNSIENAKFYFICNEKEVFPVEPNIIFKEIGDNKNLSVRFTSTLTKEDFVLLIQSIPEVKICLEVDGEVIEQSNKAFTQKITEIGVLIK